MGEVAAADPARLAGVISGCKAGQNIPHAVSCRVLGVRQSRFYKWKDKPVTAREVRRGQLADAIRRVFDASGGTHGSPKAWITLAREGWRISVNTVAKTMAELGLAGRKVRRRRGLTRPGRRAAAPDFVRYDAPDQVGAGDMTEIVTSEGNLYLATVIDVFSGRLLGYAMGAHRDAELVLASMHMAAATRGGDVKGVIFHSRGSEYVSRHFKRACRKLGVTQSMGRVGSCFDNAVSQAFNSVLKVEYVHRRTFATRTEARLKITTWITGSYNTRRLHGVCGYRSPIDYENNHQTGSDLELAA